MRGCTATSEPSRSTWRDRLGICIEIADDKNETSPILWKNNKRLILTNTENICLGAGRFDTVPFQTAIQAG